MRMPKWRRRWSRDDGMTLVEMSIALLIVAVVFAASGLFLTATIKSASNEQARVKGTQLANQVIERFRALPWLCAGFLTSDAAYAATYNGHDTVGIAPPGDASCTVNGSSIIPSAGASTVAVGHVNYTVTPHVVWDDDPSDGLGAADLSGDGGHDIKHFYVGITWGTGHQVQVQSVRAPTAAEVTPRGGSAITPFAVKTASGNPAAADLDTASKTSGAISFSVATTSNAAQVRLSWPLSDGTTGQAFMTNTGSATSWVYTLPLGTGPFNTGQVSFSVRAYDATGNTADGTANVTFSVTSGGFTTTINAPSSANVDSSGNLTSSLTITAAASANATGGMTLSYRNASGAPLSVPMTVTGQNGTYTFATGSGPFPQGNDTFTVQASGATGTATASATTTFIGPTVTPVSIDSIAFAPSLCYDNGQTYKLHRASTVTIGVNGLQSTDVVSAQFSDNLQTKYSTSDATNKISYASGPAGGATTWTFVLPAGSMDWKNKTAASVTVFATRFPDTTPTSRSFAVTLTGVNKATDCPS